MKLVESRNFDRISTFEKSFEIYIIFINGKSGNQMEANFFTEFSTSKKWYIFNENSRNQIVWIKRESKVSTLANERMLESIAG